MENLHMSLKPLHFHKYFPPALRVPSAEESLEGNLGLGIQSVVAEGALKSFLSFDQGVGR
jgi:hypothetical protein